MDSNVQRIKNLVYILTETLHIMTAAKLDNYIRSDFIS